MSPPAWRAACQAGGVWLLAGLAMALLDGHVELANLALLLVLAAALAALWLPPWAAVAVPALAVLGFNFAFVPPRGSFSVNLHQHALLLLTLLAVSGVISLLMVRQRRLAAAEKRHARRADDVQRLGELLREAEDPRQAQQGAAALQALLSGLTGSPAALLMVAGNNNQPTDAEACLLLGEADADERSGLWLCLVQGQAMGPGTGRHEEQPAWYLPMRGRGAAKTQGHSTSLGAALLRQPPAEAGEAHLHRAHAQALCDQMGLAIHRAQTSAAAAAAAAEAQAQQLRNTLLAAISHDYRTPLATILGAASSLHDQGARLSSSQQQRLAATIVGQTEQLARLTTNTLQLARLAAVEGAGRSLPPLPMDWESAEELAGSVLQRHRQRQPGQTLRLRVQPGLPLLRCDAVLLGQLLDNLVLNALNHGRNEAGHAEVELRVHRVAGTLVLAVRDRGPGVPLASREHIFSAFERGENGAGSSERGAGVGLAVCRAIARAHGGELRYRARAHGGASFECVLPVSEQPAAPAATPGDPRDDGAVP